MSCIFALLVILGICAILVYWPPVVKAVDSYWNNWLVGHIAEGVRLGKIGHSDIESRVRRNLRQGAIDRKYSKPRDEAPDQRAQREFNKKAAIEAQVATLVAAVEQRLGSQ